MHEGYSNPFSPYSKAMRYVPVLRCPMCIFGVTVLLPFRLITITIALAVCYVFAKIGLINTKHVKKPPTGWRNAIAVRGISFVVWITMFFCGFYRIKIKGVRPAGSYVTPVYVAAPRSNFLNALLPFLLRASPVYNQNVRRIPIIGSISKAMRAVLYKGKHYTPEMVEDMNRRKRETGWLPILIFPEEVYTNGATLIHFPTELFQIMTPVQPVAISYSSSAKSRTVNQSISICLLLRILCRFKHSITIKYLDVVYPDTGNENAIEFTRRVRDKLADSLGVYTSEHSKEDIQLMTSARRLGLPPLTGVVEFMALKKEFDSLTLEIAEKELVRFCQIDRRSRGCISLVDFAHFLKETTSQANSLFKNYKLDDNGCLSFRNFLEGNLGQSSGPLLSPIEEGGEKGGRKRPTNMLIQRHSKSEIYN
ncbi:Lysophosphatidylcholine acyltransferase 2 [Oopsacas minuta]|uniref:Lysophosphatidylcholine acyltransferase 2 n=1 Tax=Oopsacas minuta TaxID=111878 RepID=A0AAV7K7W4_9METZ|nr:Lysophosphatidylcholine acyltransferase 2 [Oopsacas minuta]